MTAKPKTIKVKAVGMWIDDIGGYVSCICGYGKHGRSFTKKGATVVAQKSIPEILRETSRLVDCTITVTLKGKRPTKGEKKHNVQDR